MSVKANYFKVGVFVMVAAGLLTAAVVSFAMPKLDKPIYVETYMDESVAGLSEGSQISYRGVKIGRVENISFASSRYDTVPQYAKYVVIDMVIESEKLLGKGGFADVEGNLGELIGAGLRIRITSNPLTGLSYLEADYPVGASEPLKYDWKSQYYYIPSDLSVLNKFAQSAQAAFEAMEKVDVVDLSDRLANLMMSLEVAVNDANLQKLSDKSAEMLTELTETARRINVLLGTEGDMPKSTVEEVLGNFEEALAQMQEVLADIDKVATSQQPGVEQIVEDLREFSANIKELSEELKENPNIILSKPAKTEVMR